MSSREGVEVFEQQFLLEAEAVCQAGNFRFGFVAAGFAEGLLEGGKALDGFLGRVSGKLVAGVLHVGVEFVDPASAEDVA